MVFSFSLLYFMIALALAGSIFLLAFRKRGFLAALGLSLLGLVGMAAIWIALVGVLLRNM
jgi:hypothetical protein